MPVFMMHDQMLQRFRGILSPHLEPGERLEAQIMAQGSASIGQMAAMGALSVAGRRILYLGVTDTGHLIIAEHDFMDRPVSARRMPLGQVEKAGYKEGLLVDRLTLQLQGAKAVKLQVAKWLRAQAADLVGRIPALG